MQTKFTPILIPDKNNHELGNNENQTSKNFKCSRFLDFLCSEKKSWKMREKQSIMSLSM